MKYKLTYEDALEMVKVHKNFNFSKTESKLNGYRVVTFKYFLCEFDKFEYPLKDKPNVRGYDMRGVTFIFNKDGSLYKRFLMLSKFFNLDQVETTQYGEVKNKKIENVTEKEDGSLIAFMNLPDETLFAKTIGSFDNEQTVAAMKLLNNDKKLNKFIKKMLFAGYTPLFEYVSYDNRIVLKYSKPELRFIGIRDNVKGEFIFANELDVKIPVTYVKEVTNVTLDELIERSKTEEDKEGWVVRFNDGQMIKIKTHWYWSLHGIRTMNIFREDYVIRNYLEETLDEVISQLDYVDDEDAFKFIDNVKLAVNNKLKDIDNKVNLLVEKYNIVYNKDWVKYAIGENKSAYFGLSKIMIYDSEKFNERKIEYILKKTKRLQNARFFVEKWNPNSEKYISKW